MVDFLPLSKCIKEDSNDVGYKAIRLAKIEEKIPVPFSLVITTDIFKEFINYNKLKAEIMTINSVSLDNKSELVRAFIHLTKMFEKARFPESILDELRECFELVSLDTNSLISDKGGRKKISVLSVRRSTTYFDEDFVCSGTIFTKENFGDFIKALKSSYLSLFSPSSLTKRKEKGISDFSSALIISRVPNINVCFETKISTQKNTINVQSYKGFIDTSYTIARDSFVMNVDFLKINDYKILPQNTVALFDLENNKIKISEFNQQGSSQSCTEQIVLEAGRLTKKIRSILDVKELSTELIMDNQQKIHCLSVSMDSPEFKPVEKIQEAPAQNFDPKDLGIKVDEEIENTDTNELVTALKNFLKRQKFSRYSPTAVIILRSLNENPTREAIMQALHVSKQIIDEWN